MKAFCIFLISFEEGREGVRKEGRKDGLSLILVYSSLGKEGWISLFGILFFWDHKHMVGEVFQCKYSRFST